MKRILLLLPLLFLTLSCGESGDETTTTIEYVRRPVVEGENILDDSIMSTKAYAGKVVIVDFFASWCHWCEQIIPNLQELEAEYPERLAVIGVAYNDYSVEATVEFCEELGVDYPVVVGTETMAMKFGGISGLPTMFILNGEGELAATQVGYASYEELEATFLAVEAGL